MTVIPFHRRGGGRGISMFAEMEVGVGGTKAFFGPFLSVNLRKFIFPCLQTLPTISMHAFV